MDVVDFNHDRVAAIFNSEIEDDRSQFEQLGKQLSELANFVNQAYKTANTEQEKAEKVEASLEYLAQGVASLAYSLTVGTQRIDESLNLCAESLGILTDNVNHLSVQVDIHCDTKNRAAIVDLTCARAPPYQNTTKKDSS